MMSTYVVLMALTTAVLLGAAWWWRRRASVPREVGWNEVIAEAETGGYGLISSEEMADCYRRDFQSLLLVDTRPEGEYRAGPSPCTWAQGLESFQTLEGKIDIAGGTAHIPVMKDAAEAIMKANPKIRITVAGGSSGVGVQKVGAGLVHIGNTGRALSPEEVAKYGLKTFPFAIDGVAVAVNPSNSVGALTSQQVRDIFAGKIKNWQEVGGANAPIHLFTRDEASGTRETFWEKLLKKGPIDAKANIVASNGAMKMALAQDPQAIGYLGIGFVDQKVKGIKLDGAEPTQENAKSGAYAVTRQLYMNTKGEPQPLIQAFIDYIKGPEGAKIIQKHGFIPLQ